MNVFAAPSAQWAENPCIRGCVTVEMPKVLALVVQRVRVVAATAHTVLHRGQEQVSGTSALAATQPSPPTSVVGALDSPVRAGACGGVSRAECRVAAGAVVQCQG